MGRFRRWARLEAWAVTREQALETAGAACDAKGLPWQEPVKVFRNYGDWSVWTHASHRGGNVRVIVDGGTGEVKHVAGPTPR